jgi:hypothetical protein
VATGSGNVVAPRKKGSILDDIERLSKPLNVNIIAVELTKLFKVIVLFSCRISKRALIIY